VASIDARRVALLSIRPGYARAIVNGSKRVEFRRVAFTGSVQTVVIYATKPSARVVAYFDVKGIEEAPPPTLWRMFHSVGGISREKFLEYFVGTSIGHAIKIGDATELPEPLPLDHLGLDIVPPQSFRYLPEESFRQLIPASTLGTAAR